MGVVRLVGDRDGDAHADRTRLVQPGDQAGGGRIDFAYDFLNRLTGVDYSSPSMADVTYAYDANGNRTSMAGAGATTAYGYDPSGNRAA